MTVPPPPSARPARAVAASGSAPRWHSSWPPAPHSRRSRRRRPRDRTRAPPRMHRCQRVAPNTSSGGCGRCPRRSGWCRRSAPATPYAAGHRGIDLAVEPAAVIVAPAAGVVSFAGSGRPRRGRDRPRRRSRERDRTGGAVGGAGQGRGGGRPDRRRRGRALRRGCVHFGVRVHGEYVSPLLFLGGLPRAVLLPLAVARVRGSGARVRRAVALLEPLGRHVRVDLRRAEARVAEELLHRAQVRAAVEQVRRGGVPQGVRPLGPGRGCRQDGRDEPVHAARAHARAARAEEDGRRRLAGCRVAWVARRRRRTRRPPASPAARLEVSIDRTSGGRTVGHHPLLRALAGDAHGAAPPVDVVDVEADELGDAQRRRVEQFDDRDVAYRDRVAARRPGGEGASAPSRAARRPRAAGCAARAEPSVGAGVAGEDPAPEPGVKPRADAARRAIVARARPRSVATQSQSRSRPRSMPAVVTPRRSANPRGRRGRRGTRRPCARSTRARSSRGRGSRREASRLTLSACPVRLGTTRLPGAADPRLVRRPLAREPLEALRRRERLDLGEEVLVESRRPGTGRPAPPRSRRRRRRGGRG